MACGKRAFYFAQVQQFRLKPLFRLDNDFVSQWFNGHTTPLVDGLYALAAQTQQAMQAYLFLVDRIPKQKIHRNGRWVICSGTADNACKYLRCGHYQQSDRSLYNCVQPYSNLLI